MAKLRLEIVTAERPVYAEEVEVVVAPGAEGELGILPRHAGLITLLQPGELRIRKDGEETNLAIGGGFMEVRPDRVIVLADTAERAEEIDEARAEAARQRAADLLQRRVEASEDLTAALAQLRRSQVRLKVARRRRGQPL